MAPLVMVAASALLPLVIALVEPAIPVMVKPARSIETLSVWMSMTATGPWR
jgi:hypothetical protein